MATIDGFEAQIGDALRGGTPVSPFGTGSARMASAAPKAAPPAPPRNPGENAVGALDNAHIGAHALAARVVELADLLCGSPSVQPQGIAALPPTPPGLLPTLEENAARLRDHLQVAHDAITRIRNHLPSS